MTTNRPKIRPQGTTRPAAGALLALLLAASGCAPGAEAEGPARAASNPGPTAEAGRTSHGLVPLPPDAPVSAPRTWEPAALEAALARVLEQGERTYHHEFGEVPDLTSVLHTWRLYNSDPHPVTIRKIAVPCTCTVATVRTVGDDGTVVQGRLRETGRVLVVPPGEVAELTIRIDGGEVRGKNLPKLEVLTVDTNSRTRPYLSLEANLTVVAEFQTTPPVLDLGRVGASGDARGELTTIAFPGRTMTLLEPLEVPPDLAVEVRYDPRLDRPRWITSVTLLGPQEEGRLERDFTIATANEDGTPGPPYPMHVAASVAPDVEVLPGRFVVRGAGGARVDLVSHVSGHRLRILRVEVRGDAAESLRVEQAAVQPDEDGRSGRFTLSLLPLDGAGELTGNGVVAIDLDDPQTPRIEVPYVLAPRP